LSEEGSAAEFHNALVIIGVAGPIGILGPLVFVGGLGSTLTFHSSSKKRQNSFVKHQIINGNDLLEDTGVKPIEVELEMRFFEPLDCFSKFKSCRARGVGRCEDPRSFVGGWRSIREERSHAFYRRGNNVENAKIQGISFDRPGCYGQVMRVWQSPAT
jgi:hypothetical protein